MRLDSTPATQGTGGASTLGEATARALAGEGVQVPIFEFDAEVLAAPAAEIGCVFSAAELTDDNVVDAGFAGGREARYLCLLEKTIAINLVGTLRCIAKSSAGEVTLDPLDARGSATRSPTLQQWRRRTGRSARHSLQLRKAECWLAPVRTRDLMNEGIRMNTILPGNFESPMMACMPKRVQDTIAAMALFFERLGKAAEYAECALFQLGRDHMNGECVGLDDAIHMGRR